MLVSTPTPEGYQGNKTLLLYSSNHSSKNGRVDKNVSCMWRYRIVPQESKGHYTNLQGYKSITSIVRQMNAFPYHLFS